jgi:hypothetical protein
MPFTVLYGSKPSIPAARRLLAESKPIKRVDDTHYKLEWQKENPHANEDRLIFRIHMQKTKLYALWFE